ncbi:MAG: diguanylate cyclase [Nocardioidaceae bacterium]|nr:diguanylate cyclase [Nocardioidaceae bacterium]
MISQADMFDLAPVSLWLEDYSAVREKFAVMRSQGVTDLRAHLEQRPEVIVECMACIVVLGVNRRTLQLLEAQNLEHLVSHLGEVFDGDVLDSHVGELVRLWDGHLDFTTSTVNYSLSGRRIDIVLNATVLPGHEDTWSRVLVSIEDVTDRANAERALLASQQYAQGLFEHSPVSLWVEDFAAVKVLIDEVRDAGVVDFRTFTNVHPEFVERCMQEIRLIDVNQQTLTMFGGADKFELRRRMNEIFRDEMLNHFTEQLIDLWNGKLHQQREAINYSLSGERVDVYMQFSVMPGHTEDWSLVLVSLTDITARKKAEAYLEFLGKHDTLTKLRNRSFFGDEIARLDRRGPWPVTVVVADINGLKGVNDDGGHAAGDSLLRRAGEVLSKAVDKHVCVARIGGDEFVMLLPATDAHGGEQMMERIRELSDLNNQFYGGAALSFSMGIATCREGEMLEPAVHVADQRMYEDKKVFYRAQDRDRRR